MSTCFCKLHSVTVLLYVSDRVLVPAEFSGLRFVFRDGAMSSKILTSDIIDFDAFYHNPREAIAQTAQGTVAVFEQNAPVFYALSAERLAVLLSLEARLATPPSDVMLEALFFEETAFPAPVAAPPGKFAMYPGWQPDADFQRIAALWGTTLTHTVTPEELSSFIAYWQAEGKVFHHIQWQQKLARSLQIGRQQQRVQAHDINTIGNPDYNVFKGFRG